MASRSNSNGGGGWIAALLVVGLVLFVLFWSLSTVGHVLGLTPTYTEAFESPEGWVDKHYRGVVWGYVLTVLAILAVATLGWLGSRAQSQDPARVAHARAWLRQAQVATLALALAIVFLPIGQRPGIGTAVGAVGPAAEGNVPDLVGMTAANAEATLDDRNLYASFSESPSDDERCRVVSQAPGPGAEVDEYGDVLLHCVVHIPRVVGKKTETAAERLFDAGFDTRLVNEPDDYDLSRCRVRSQSKTGSAPPNASVRLKLRCTRPEPKQRITTLADAPPEPEPTNECDPNYEGACLDPNSADYDCDGGEGNGPDYTGPVTVVGDDHHELNRDPEEDSTACEAS